MKTARLQNTNIYYNTKKHQQKLKYWGEKANIKYTTAAKTAATTIQLLHHHYYLTNTSNSATTTTPPLSLPQHQQQCVAIHHHYHYHNTNITNSVTITPPPSLLQQQCHHNIMVCLFMTTEYTGCKHNVTESTLPEPLKHHILSSRTRHNPPASWLSGLPISVLPVYQHANYARLTNCNSQYLTC